MAKLYYSKTKNTGVAGVFSLKNELTAEKGSDQKQSGTQRDHDDDALPDILDDFF